MKLFQKKASKFEAVDLKTTWTYILGVMGVLIAAAVLWFFISWRGASNECGTGLTGLTKTPLGFGVQGLGSRVSGCWLVGFGVRGLELRTLEPETLRRYTSNDIAPPTLKLLVYKSEPPNPKP